MNHEAGLQASPSNLCSDGRGAHPLLPALAGRSTSCPLSPAAMIFTLNDSFSPKSKWYFFYLPHSLCFSFNKTQHNGLCGCLQTSLKPSPIRFSPLPLSPPGLWWLILSPYLPWPISRQHLIQLITATSSWSTLFPWPIGHPAPLRLLLSLLANSLAHPHLNTGT